MKKLLNKKGFTLMEMLIVVAIIVILVAISIPAFSGALDKANYATDAANLRAAKAAYLVEKQLNGTFDTSKPVYDVAKGVFVATETPSGKCSDHSKAWLAVIGDDVVWTEDGENAKTSTKCCK